MKHRDWKRERDRYTLLQIILRIQQAMKIARGEFNTSNQLYLDTLGAYKAMTAELQTRVRVHVDYHRKLAESNGVEFKFSQADVEGWMTVDEIGMKTDCILLYTRHTELKEGCELLNGIRDKLSGYLMKFQTIFRRNESAIAIQAINEPLEMIAGMNVQTLIDNVSTSLEESISQYGAIDTSIDDGMKDLEAARKRVAVELRGTSEAQILGLAELLDFKPHVPAKPKPNESTVPLATIAQKQHPHQAEIRSQLAENTPIRPFW